MFPGRVSRRAVPPAFESCHYSTELGLNPGSSETTPKSHSWLTFTKYEAEKEGDGLAFQDTGVRSTSFAIGCEAWRIIHTARESLAHFGVDLVTHRAAELHGIHPLLAAVTCAGCRGDRSNCAVEDFFSSRIRRRVEHPPLTVEVTDCEHGEGLVIGFASGISYRDLPPSHSQLF